MTAVNTSSQDSSSACSADQNHIALHFNYDAIRDAKNIVESSRLSFHESLSYLVGFGGSIFPQATTWPDVVDAASSFDREHRSLIESVLASFTSHWQTFRKPVLDCLHEIFNERLSIQTVNVYLTSCSRCPYDPNAPSFMVSIWASPLEVVYTCAHELFHIHFWRINGNRIRELPNAASSNLLESFIAILNDELPKHIPIVSGSCRIDTPDGKVVRDIWRRTRNLHLTVGEAWNKLEHCSQFAPNISP